jgi:hypothetical protein
MVGAEKLRLASLTTVKKRFSDALELPNKLV